MFCIDDEENIPQQLLDAKAEGKTIQVLTVIGYIDCDDEVEFRNGVNYKIKEN